MTRWPLWTTTIVLVCACGGGTPDDDAGMVDSNVDVPPDSMPIDSADTAGPELSLVAVEPNRGPFRGGTRAILRGTAFTDATLVTFGGTAADSITLLDQEQLEVVVPPGTGSVDVVVSEDDASATLANGYTYESIAVTPPVGSLAGGTLVFVEVADVALSESDSVSFDGSPCTDVTVDATRISCRTPAGTLGPVEVSVMHAEGTIVADAFEYIDPIIPSGGVGGGPIERNIDLTVLDAVSSEPVADAVVMLGDDESSALRAQTNTDGRVTLSAPDLVGPVSLHVGKLCYETTSFIGMNARRATVLLTPWTSPSCPEVPEPEDEVPATVTGELVWGDPSTGPHPWANVPPAGDGEARVAYVLAARRVARVPNPPSEARVTEADAGAAGYSFSVVAPAAGDAVFALAGVENSSTGEFAAYVMGVVGDLALASGETRENVDIAMDIPLDRQVQVQLTGLPEPVRTGPDRFEVTLAPRLGEAVLFRESHASRIGAFSELRFVPEPPLEGVLASASYDLIAAWATGADGGHPNTTRFVRATRPTAAGFTVDDFMSIPQPISPEFGGRLAVDRTFRWDETGGADIALVELIGADGNPTWRAIVRGDLRAARIPDLSAFGVPDVPEGFFTWRLAVVRVPDLEFDQLLYSTLRFEESASHLAVDVFAGQRQ